MTQGFCDFLLLLTGGGGCGQCAGSMAGAGPYFRGVSLMCSCLL